MYIHPTTSTNIYGGSLYQAEEGNMDKLESALVRELTALPNVKWWHRNISRQGFCINGFINHYPDFIVMTHSGRIILVEPKGEHLKNDDSREKSSWDGPGRMLLGVSTATIWCSGTETTFCGAVSMSQFVELMKEL